MPSLSFPESPSIGDQYSFNGNTWTWDGQGWTLNFSSSPTLATLTAQNFIGPLTGDVTGNVTGNLTGNVTGNLTGNASTVTNGVYTTGTYSNPNWLTSIPGSIVSGAITGSAAKLTTPVHINGVSFDGSGDISVPIAASDISGNTLASNVLSSSLTSVGNLTGLTTANISVTGNITASGTTGVISYGTLSYQDTNIIANFTTNVNSYAQVILENTSNGNAASTDFIVSNNAGSALTYYGDFGINSSGFVGNGSLGLANAVYLYSANSDLSIGTANSSPIHFVINGSATDTMTISSTGVTVNGGTTLNGSSNALALNINNAAETVAVISSALPAQVVFYVATQSIMYYTTANTTTSGFSIAVYGSASTNLNTMMSVGQSVSIALFVTNGSGAAYPTTFTIDGNIVVTPKWANGQVVTTNTYSTDVYNFSIIKTAASTFTVLGSQLRYA